MEVKTYLVIIPALPQTPATPNHMVGQPTSLITYFNTMTVTLPAKPPASNAKPRNSTSLAFQATAESPL